MARPEKVAIVDEIAEKIERTQSLFLTDFSGLDVESINELRRLLREQAVEFRVVKNTLARLAAVKAGREDLKPHLVGPTALAFGYENPVLPAKLLSSFAQKTGKPAVKAILFEGQLLGQEAMDLLKALPAREEMLAKMLGSLKAPLFQTVMILSGLLRSLVSALDAMARKGSEEGKQGPSEGATEVHKTEVKGKTETEAKAQEEVDAAVAEEPEKKQGTVQKATEEVSSPNDKQKPPEENEEKQGMPTADDQDSEKQ